MTATDGKPFGAYVKESEFSHKMYDLQVPRVKTADPSAGNKVVQTVVHKKNQGPRKKQDLIMAGRAS